MLIPLLLMGGIIGRLFREFAVTLAMTILVSAIVSLTLTPMMASRFLSATAHDKHGRLYMLSERGFDGFCTGTNAASTSCFGIVSSTLMVFLRDRRRRRSISSSSFPRDSSLSRIRALFSATSDAPQDISFAEMTKRQQEFGAIVQADPDVATVAMALGAGVGNAAQNNGRMFITLKPRERARSRRVPDHRAAAPEARRGEGRAAFPAGGAGRERRRRAPRARNFSSRCRTPISTN